MDRIFFRTWTGSSELLVAVVATAVNFCEAAVSAAPSYTPPEKPRTPQCRRVFCTAGNFCLFAKMQRWKKFIVIYCSRSCLCCGCARFLFFSSIFFRLFLRFGSANECVVRADERMTTQGSATGTTTSPPYPQTVFGTLSNCYAKTRTIPKRPPPRFSLIHTSSETFFFRIVS